MNMITGTAKGVVACWPDMLEVLGSKLSGGVFLISIPLDNWKLA